MLVNYLWRKNNRNYSVSGLNQITQAGALSLSYDGRGNLVGDGTNTYSYSSENYLTAGPDGLRLSYDPLGRLYETRKDGNAVTRFGYDGQDLIAGVGDERTKRGNPEQAGQSKRARASGSEQRGSKQNRPELSAICSGLPRRCAPRNDG